MTGEEFYEKIKIAKKITEISYDVDGDFMNPDKVELKVVTDNDEFIFSLGSPKMHDRADTLLNSIWIQRVCVCLVVNRLMELQGRPERFNINCGIDIQKAISFAIKCINESKN